MAAIFDAAYLEGDTPRAQSGFGGDAARWEAGRRPIAEAIDCDGSFLDIGCANGHLVESIVHWSPHRIEPYGLDFAPAVAELARQRLPQWADRIFVGNALTSSARSSSTSRSSAGASTPLGWSRRSSIQAAG
jgi:hypothetical protein